MASRSAKKVASTKKSLRDKIFASKKVDPIDVDCGDGIIVRLRVPSGGEVQRATMRHTKTVRKGKGAKPVTDSVSVLYDLIHACAQDPATDEQIFEPGERAEIGDFPNSFLMPLVSVMSGLVNPRPKADSGNSA